MKNLTRKCIFPMIVIFGLSFFTFSAAIARNADLSLWSKNLSEPTLAEETGLKDTNADIQISGSVVHVMWLTDIHVFDQIAIYYKRSLNNGATWQPKQLLWTGAYDKPSTVKRMAVSGNDVHILVGYDSGGFGASSDSLLYLRSRDGGATFDAPRTVFTSAQYWGVSNTLIQAEGDHVTLCFNYYGAEQYQGRLLISADGGDTFYHHTVYDSGWGTSDGWGTWDMQRSGNNIVVVYEQSRHYYGSQWYYRNLYAASSTDAGATFHSQLISVPSLDGSHQAQALQESNYVPKIAIDGSHVSIIWTGLDGENVQSVFLRHSDDSGATFDNAVNLTKNEAQLSGAAFQPGQETLAAKNGHVYAIFMLTDGMIYLKRSANNAADFETLQPLFGGWWPVIQIDPTDATGMQVYVLAKPPRYSFSTDGGATFSGVLPLSPAFSWIGYSPQNPKMAIGPNRTVHWADAGSWTWYSVGVFGDEDIFHNRRLVPPAPSGGNMALHLATKVNAGDGTGDERCDNMAIANSPGITFSTAMTAEIWIKPETGSSNNMKVLVKENAQTAIYTPQGYQFGTHDSGGIRYPNAGIRTVNERFMNWGSPELPDNTWTHLAMTYDANAGANNFILYVNGQISTSLTATGVLYPGEGLLYVGGPCFPFSENFNGDVDELRLWNRALSQSEIQDRMNQALTGNESGLAAYYSFDNTTKDLTGNGNDGVLMYKESYSVSATAPSVTTTAVSAVTSTSASGGGNVTSSGGATVTARGVCWSTSVNPTTSDGKTTDGSGVGIFTSEITGLNPNTTYHVRAYATGKGTGYGSDISFKTAYAGAFYVSSDGDCGDKTPCYDSIQKAIEAAATGSVILIEQGTYSESITLNESKALTLQGGWDPSFDTQTSNTTRFIKAPTAPTGSLTMQMVTIKP